MFKSELYNDEYFDFKLTDDCRSYNRDYTTYRVINVDFTNNLSSSGTSIYNGSGVTLANIGLTGYDNFLLSGGTQPIPNNNLNYVINNGDTFKFHQVSGYTLNLNVENAGGQYIDQFRGIQIPHDFYHNPDTGKSSGYTYEISGEIYLKPFKKLNGGFYEGFFKLYNYPVEFFKPRMKKGWTINELLYTNIYEEQPTIGDTQPSYYSYYFNFKPLTSDNIDEQFEFFATYIGNYGSILYFFNFVNITITSEMVDDPTIFYNLIVDGGPFEISGNTISYKTENGQEGQTLFFYDNLGLIDGNYNIPEQYNSFLGYETIIIDGDTYYQLTYNFNEFNTNPDNIGQTLNIYETLLNSNNLPLYNNVIYSSPTIDDTNLDFIISEFADVIGGTVSGHTVTKTISDATATQYIYFSNINAFDNNIHVANNAIIASVYEPFIPELYTHHTLNNDYPDNAGIIFYMGTRAENKFSEFTIDEITGITNDFDIDFTALTGLVTDNTGFYTPDGKRYFGYYNITSGITYSNRIKDDSSVKLTKYKPYNDITDNAFAVYIKTNGHVGYRVIYTTDKCYSGQTQNPNDINYESFEVINDPCTSNIIKRIVTSVFTIEDVMSSSSLIDTESAKFTFITVKFERDLPYDGCVLENYDFGKYRTGTLKIYANGFKIFEHKDCPEVIPHILDTESIYQEGVPFNISVGGGTQNLLESISYDSNKEYNTILEKFFAGTFMGGITNFEMYITPLYLHEIRKQRDLYTTDFELFNITGGRIINYKHQL
jgi:hypothetical protein